MRAERLVAGGRACPAATTVGSCSSTARSPASWSRSRSRHATAPTRARWCGSSSRRPTGSRPVCPHVADGCGGCDLADPRARAPRSRAKVELVTDALRRLGRWAEPVVRAGPALDPWGFRTTLRLAVTGGRAGLRRAAEPRRRRARPLPGRAPAARRADRRRPLRRGDRGDARASAPRPASAWRSSRPTATACACPTTCAWSAPTSSPRASGRGSTRRSPVAAGGSRPTRSSRPGPTARPRSSTS